MRRTLNYLDIDGTVLPFAVGTLDPEDENWHVILEFGPFPDMAQGEHQVIARADPDEMQGRALLAFDPATHLARIHFLAPPQRRVGSTRPRLRTGAPLRKGWDAYRATGGAPDAKGASYY